MAHVVTHWFQPLVFSFVILHCLDCNPVRYLQNIKLRRGNISTSGFFPLRTSSSEGAFRRVLCLGIWNSFMIRMLKGVLHNALSMPIIIADSEIVMPPTSAASSGSSWWAKSVIEIRSERYRAHWPRILRRTLCWWSSSGWARSSNRLSAFCS